MHIKTLLQMEWFYSLATVRHEIHRVFRTEDLLMTQSHTKNGEECNPRIVEQIQVYIQFCIIQKIFAILPDARSLVKLESVGLILYRCDANS